MPTSPERGYEDSYQKRERLLGELKSAINDIRESFNVFKKDTGEVADSFEKVDSTKKRMDELMEQKGKLEEKLKAQQAELANFNESEAALDDKIDTNAALSLEINSTREKILEIWEEMDFLIGELDKIVEEEPGQAGDFEGTMAVIKMKMQRIGELKKQLDELEE